MYIYINERKMIVKNKYQLELKLMYLGSRRIELQKVKLSIQIQKRNKKNLKGHVWTHNSPTGRISNRSGVVPLYVTWRGSGNRRCTGDSNVLSSRIWGDCNVLGNGLIGDSDKLCDWDATIGSWSLFKGLDLCIFVVWIFVTDTCCSRWWRQSSGVMKG